MAGWRYVPTGLLALALAACQTTPDVGSRGRVEVAELPATRAALHTWQSVDEELEPFEPAIREARLWSASCVIPDASAYDGARDWKTLVLMPRRGMAGPKAVVAIRPLGPDSAGGRVYGFSAQLEPVPAQAYFERHYAGSGRPYRDLRCEMGADGFPGLVELDMPLQTWTLEFSKAERARHRQFTDQDFAQGRVGLGRCALRDFTGEAYHQPIWLLHIPPGMEVRPGEVVELELGETETGGGIGKVSTMVRKLGTRADFPHDRGAAVDCR